MTVKTTNVTATYAESGKPDINWTTQSVSTEDYDFGALEDIAEEFKDATHTTTCFVIPQSNENLEVTFTATFYDAANKQLSENQSKENWHIKAMLAAQYRTNGLKVSNITIQ